MVITLTVPTLGKMSNVFNEMVLSLNEQSFRDFKVFFIVPRNYKGGGLRETLEKTDIDFTIEYQNGSGFENAMNKALEVSGDVNLNMDDDAIYSHTHVESYLKLFDMTNAGIIFGKVNNMRPYFNRTIFFLEMQNMANKTPLLSSPRHYAIYLNSAGFLSSHLSSIVSPYRKIRLNANPIGVNMGWSRDAVEDFRLLEFSKKGTINEAYIALAAMIRNFPVYETNLINVKHGGLTDSLSRGNRSDDIIVKITELLFSPLVIQTFHEINSKDFDRTITKLKKILGLIPSHITEHFSNTLDIIYDGIQEQWDKFRIRERYNEIVSHKAQGDTYS